MGNGKHTAGPWQAQNYSVLQHHSEAIGLIAEALPGDEGDLDDPEAHANARLIAQAPAMKMEIEEMVSFLELGPISPTEAPNRAKRLRAILRAIDGEGDGDA